TLDGAILVVPRFERQMPAEAREGLPGRIAAEVLGSRLEVEVAAGALEDPDAALAVTSVVGDDPEQRGCERRLHQRELLAQWIGEAQRRMQGVRLPDAQRREIVLGHVGKADRL